jgi:hypothetical protein
MTEAANPRRIGPNPLGDDLVLFNMFMGALDDIVANPEIRDALNEFRLPSQTLRGIMILGARQVLMAAPREFEDYERVLWRATGGPKFKDGPEPPVEADFRRMVRLISTVSTALGLFFIVSGLASFPLWPWTKPLMWAGISMIAVAGFLYSAPRLATGLELRLLTGEVALNADLVLEEARNRLMAALGQEEFLAQARTFINTTRKDQFNQAYSVTNISGLSETYDATYQVSTYTATELSSLLTRLGGASIGIAGPRGSGKSTLIRGYCSDIDSIAAENEGSFWSRLLDDGISRPQGGDLRCMVSAPVDYVARDFILHLFAVFCRSVIRRYDNQDSALSRMSILAMATRFADSIVSLLFAIVSCSIRYGIPSVALIHWQQPIASTLGFRQSWIYYLGIAIAVFGIIRLAWAPARIARQARQEAFSEIEGRETKAKAKEHLERVRYLQTFTSGWSGTLSLASTGGQYSHSKAQAEQPLSYPEIIDEFRRFASEVAVDAHRRGDRVFVGIDELDKIGPPEQAERFLNEIKGVFGIPHTYFMVSVSDDALTAFERRGLPLRDAFDSSFDEIIHVGPLSYAESRRLLYRRVIGLTEPYVALCHCLAGGLPRELIRAARQVTRVSSSLIGDDDASPTRRDEFNVDSSNAFLLLREPSLPRSPDLSKVCGRVIRDELRRKAQAAINVASSLGPGKALNLQVAFHEILHRLTLDIPAMEIVGLACQSFGGLSTEVTSLRLDFAAYAYYCATVQDVFTDSLDVARMIDATSASSYPGTFDALAAARQAFMVDTNLAWQSVTQFREAWFLETREPPSLKSVSEP